MALIGYARVSSEDQSLEVQIKQLTDAGCELVFAEKKSGTGTLERAELARCLQYVRNGDVLMVTRIDRMARSMRDFFKTLGDLSDREVAFRCLLQPEIDTTTTNGRLITGILAAIAEFETAVRAERQREGIEAAKAKGVYKTRKGDHPAGRMAHASRLLRKGATYRQTTEATGIPGPTLRRRFPGYNVKAPYRNGRSARENRVMPGMEALVPTHHTPTKAGGKKTTPENKPAKRGLFGLLPFGS